MGARFPSAATCRVDQDGGITVVTGAVDMSGTNTSFAAIAADTFGVPLSQVRVSYADTATAPHAPPSGGSGVTYSVGQSVRLAAQDAKDQLLDFASGQMDVAVTDLEVVDGMVRPVGSPDRGLSVGHFAAQVTGFVAVAPPLEGRGRFAPGNPSPSVACHIAHVRVDPDTGEVTALDYAVIQDVGKALNPALVRGQLQGGAVQSIGWALYEELQHDEHGQLLSGSFMQYAVPRADLVPHVQIDYIEMPSAVGPFGAKGIAEAAVMAGTGAMANAVAAAIGARVRELPMTAPRVWRALTAK
jgi:CO/xanthine dehydrogenase Mo-binding subunit